uniref:Uncharacterized protein n=1 Tax=Polysiphonia infestans TaxID=2006978 RepID=A0A1Z1MF31_9FLOR|nr:hypothetical protein [Polysiphonia infestans]ARW64371.1 hypothetical protein [Polysiphonia infestans]
MYLNIFTKLMYTIKIIKNYCNIKNTIITQYILR